jgi:hypothetical protein
LGLFDFRDTGKCVGQKACYELPDVRVALDCRIRRYSDGLLGLAS